MATKSSKPRFASDKGAHRTTRNAKDVARATRGMRKENFAQAGVSDG